MRTRFRFSDEAEELNIMPLMNIVMLLIPFLLMSSQFIKIGVISVKPRMDTACPDCPAPPKTKPLNLTIAITQKGFSVLTRGGRLKPDCQTTLPSNEPRQRTATFPRVDGKYNYVALRRCVMNLKKSHPKETRIVLMPEPKVPYKQVVKLMDVTRDDGQGKLLFPKVQFSVGVL